MGKDGTMYVVEERRFYGKGIIKGILYAVTQKGILKWTFTSDEEINYVVVGREKTIYLTTAHSYSDTSIEGLLYALNLNGKVMWKFSIPLIPTFITVDENETIYVTSANELSTFGPDGHLKWTYAMEGKGENPGMIEGAPAISNDGTIYTTSCGYLYAFFPDGKLKWSERKYAMSGTPVIGNDGTIYVSGAGDIGPCIFAYSPDGNFKWKYCIDAYISTPSVSRDNTIYLLIEKITSRNKNNEITKTESYLIALNPNGTLKWQFRSNGFDEGNLYSQQPIIDKKSVIYFSADYPKSIVAVNSDGTLKWKIDNPSPSGSYLFGPHLIDNNERLYFSFSSGISGDLPSDIASEVVICTIGEK